MSKTTYACAAFAAAFIALGWRDALAGAWLGMFTIAGATLAISLLVSRRPAKRAVRAADAEALAWTESGSMGGGGLSATAR